MQICKFGFVGGVQLLVDCALFVLMTWLGLGVVLSSLVSRSGGAALGFWLNGKYTFAGNGSRLGSGQMIRFLVTLLLMAVTSSSIVWIVAHSAGLGRAWLVKPAADAMLALLSFFISKNWIYR